MRFLSPTGILFSAFYKSKEITMSNTQKHIEAMKEWCMENYSNGADTMAECWEDEDYEDLFASCDGNPDDAWLALKTLAEVYSDQQADARNSAF
jgi:hypothetical protein